MSSIGIGLVGASAVVMGSRLVEADDGGVSQSAENPEHKCTDSDTGTFADPVGLGDRCGSGCTDSDTGAFADPVGAGDRCGGGCITDSDAGCSADPVCEGRG